MKINLFININFSQQNYENEYLYSAFSHHIGKINLKLYSKMVEISVMHSTLEVVAK